MSDDATTLEVETLLARYRANVEAAEANSATGPESHYRQQAALFESVIRSRLLAADQVQAERDRLRAALHALTAAVPSHVPVSTQNVTLD